jgi:hypothetical protein
LACGRFFCGDFRADEEPCFVLLVLRVERVLDVVDRLR